MEYVNIKTLLTVLLLCLFCIPCNGQHSDKLIIRTETANDLIAGIDNYILIMAMQDRPLSAEQVSAFLITPSYYLSEKEPVELAVIKEHGRFKIHPDSVGVVKFYIKINDTIEVETIRVKPLEAVCRLSRYKANTEARIPVPEFKAQLGLVAYVECCGFEATCKMLGFEIIRIGVDGTVASTLNTGGRFEESSRDLINQTQSGDIYLFRNIYYRCPATEKQRSEDMVFDIE